MMNIKQLAHDLAAVVAHTAIIIGVAMLVVLASGQSTAAGSEPAAEIPGNALIPAGHMVPMAPEECVLVGMEAAPEGLCSVDTEVYSGAVVALSAPELEGDEPEHPGMAALRAAGYSGDAADERSVLYAPLDLTLADASGTWTVTAYGLVRCRLADQAC